MQTYGLGLLRQQHLRRGSLQVRLHQSIRALVGAHVSDRLAGLALWERQQARKGVTTIVGGSSLNAIGPRDIVCLSNICTLVVTRILGLRDPAC